MSQQERIKVLIADQSPIVTDGLKSILRASPDIEVVGAASNGAKAIEEAGRLRPDVVLLDAGLVNPGGGNLVESIKTSSPGSRALFMVVHYGDVDAAKDAAADGHIMKDSGREELLRAIRRVSGTG